MKRIKDKFDKAAAYAGAINVVIALILTWMMFSSCETTATAKRSTRKARITFYDPSEIDKVRVRKGHRTVWRFFKWGRRTASGIKARLGTMAGPSWMPIGTKVCIPRLKPVLGIDTFTCLDRGRLDRDGGRFDVFVDNHRVMKQLMYGMPEWMDYQIQ